MSRNDIILWFGRIATMVFTVAVVLDLYNDQRLSREIRTTVLLIVGIVVGFLFVWQVYIAKKYDGWPLIPFSFRWVVATWLGSLMTFILWIVLITFIDDLYTDLRSAVMWYQFGVSTIWFASRWVTVETPHAAGVGETGITPGS